MSATRIAVLGSGDATPILDDTTVPVPLQVSGIDTTLLPVPGAPGTGNKVVSMPLTCSGTGTVVSSSIGVASPEPSTAIRVALIPHFSSWTHL